MNKTAFKEFIKTPKGKLVLALCTMLASWVFLLFYFSSSFQFHVPSEAGTKAIQQEIRKLRNELKMLEQTRKKYERTKQNWKKLAAVSWNPGKDGDPEILLRQMISETAKKCELKLNTLGTVRISKINPEFSFAELDISANAQLEPLINFMKDIQKLKPAVSWRRITIFTMMRRPRDNNRTVNTNSNDNNLVFSAGIRVLVYDPTGTSSKKSSVSMSGNSMENHFQGPPPMMPPGGPR